MGLRAWERRAAKAVIEPGTISHSGTGFAPPGQGTRTRSLISSAVLREERQRGSVGGAGRKRRCRIAIGAPAQRLALREAAAAAHAVHEVVQVVALAKELAQSP